jgi:hypothetical protein
MDALVWIHAIVGIVLDIWMLSIPLYEVFHLQMTLVKKFSVAFMFFLGTLSVPLRPTAPGFKLTSPQCYCCVHSPPEIAHCFHRH